MNNADIPAMPVPGLSHDDDFNGLSKREYFAALAMQGIVSGLFSAQTDGGWHGWKPEEVREEAYRIAEAMLVEPEVDHE